MKLGLLEFGTGCTSPLDIVENVIHYAEAAETMGYTRFWLAEHYGASPAYGNPEMLVPIIAGLTSELKVGVAGLLMTYHNPYRVATAFKLLNNLFPHRIDLGIARGGMPAEYARRLVPALDLTDKTVWVDTFLQNSTALYSYLLDPAFANQITPCSGHVPAIWSLSASLHNIMAIASLNTSLCKSLFHSDIASHERDAERLQHYREEFYHRHQTVPEVNLAVAGLCADTDQKARQIQANLQRPASVSNEIVGSPTYILDELARLSELYGVDEIIFMNMAEETGHKQTGIELLAKHLGHYTESVESRFCLPTLV
ncbi:LLM class flavin-dependent oxidoreductase [Larkinella ripae]